MQANNSFNCSICSLTYNHQVNLPKLIPACGHTICSCCLDKIFQRQQPFLCPIDQVMINDQPTNSTSFPTNQIALQLLDQHLCKIHKEIKTLFCLKEKETICFSCVENGEHKSHETLQIDAIKNDSEKI